MFDELRLTARDDSRAQSILKPEFPRPRTLRALLDAAHGPEAATQSLHLSPIVPTGNIYSQAWYVMHNLEMLVKPAKECIRRGCKSRVKKKCKDCGETGYCGTGCQKMYV